MFACLFACLFALSPVDVVMLKSFMFLSRIGDDNDDHHAGWKSKVEKLSVKKKGVGSEAKAEQLAQADTDLQLLSHAEQERQLLKQKKRQNQGHEEDVRKHFTLLIKFPKTFAYHSSAWAKIQSFASFKEICFVIDAYSNFKSLCRRSSFHLQPTPIFFVVPYFFSLLECCSEHNVNISKACIVS